MNRVLSFDQSKPPLWGEAQEFEFQLISVITFSKKEEETQAQYKHVCLFCLFRFLLKTSGGRPHRRLRGARRRGRLGRAGGGPLRLGQRHGASGLRSATSASCQAAHPLVVWSFVFVFFFWGGPGGPGFLFCQHRCPAWVSLTKNRWVPLVPFAKAIYFPKRPPMVVRLPTIGAGCPGFLFLKSN